MKHFFAPSGWSHTDANPFTSDGSYAGCWSAFCLTDEDSDGFITGQSGRGPFSARFGRRVPRVERRLADFLRYENRQGRAVIVSLPGIADPAAYIAAALANTPDENIPRPEDPEVLVHATTAPAWDRIRAGGSLKAAALLTGAAHPERAGGATAVDDYLLHEPPEYREYIMFGEMDSCGPEIVMASNQAGTFVMDPNAVFQPGLRLYFDNHSLIRAGLGVRDGLHVMKVHQQLPLQPHLIAAIGLPDIDPDKQVTTWTILDFKEKANSKFRERAVSK